MSRLVFVKRNASLEEERESFGIGSGLDEKRRSEVDRRASHKLSERDASELRSEGENARERRVERVVRINSFEITFTRPVE